MPTRGASGEFTQGEFTGIRKDELRPYELDSSSESDDEYPLGVNFGLNESEDELSLYKLDSSSESDGEYQPVGLVSYAEFALGNDRPSASTSRSITSSRGSASDSGEVSEKSVFDWKKAVNSRNIRPFAEKHGPRLRVSKTSTAMDVFMKFFTSAIIDQIVNFTNLNAGRKLAVTPKSETPSKTAQWRPVSHDEMKAFFGITILMGIIGLPALQMYWQKKYWTVETPAFGKILTRKRFSDIWKYLHFCDESNADDDPARDRLDKIRPLIDAIIPNFQSAYTPARDLSIDESMIPFKGRLSFKQFMRAKRTRFGIKAWVLAESLTGYVSNFQIYTGKELRRTEILSTRVVMDLLAPYLQKGHHLYVDNFYASPMLFKSLLEQSTYACGTLELTGSIPPKK